MDSEALVAVARSFGGLSMCVVGAALGARMLRLARRTRQLPELAIGLHVIALIVGYAVEFAGMQLASTHPAVGFWLRAFANLCYAICIHFYLLFTWRVFAPRNRWAMGAVVVLTLALAIGWMGEVLTTEFGFAAARFAAPWFWLAFVPRMLGMGWASIEALVHYTKLRRRLVLGLADPLAANRLLLWALAALSEWMIYGIVATTILAGRPEDYITGAAAFWVSAFGVSGAFCMWFGFFPPRAYEGWVLARASGLQNPDSIEG